MNSHANQFVFEGYLSNVLERGDFASDVGDQLMAKEVTHCDS